MSKEGESFKDLFARGEVDVGRARRLSIGDDVEGVVTHVGKEAVFVELGKRQQAFFDVLDLKAPDGTLAVKTGETVRGYVVAIDGDQIRLGRKLSRDGTSTEHLRAAFEGQVPVEGKITGANKGGVEVDLGGARAFCPFSQLDLRRVDDANAWVGRTLDFAITKLEERDVVVSRRILLEREARDARERVLASLEVGKIVKGRVSSIREFGLFVDLGGIEGLVHVRELSLDRVRPEDVAKVGDIVETQVRSIEKKADKIEIGLSMRSLIADPWDSIETVAPADRVIAGQVSRVADFGAFVRLAAGVEGLLHVSELGARVRQANEALEVGQTVLVRVVSIDRDRKRIALALASEGAEAGGHDAGAAAIVVGSLVTGTVEKIENWGIVVQLAGTRGRGGRASLPNAETGARAGADLRKEFPLGTVITAKVIEASAGRTKISIRAVHEDAERAEFDGYKQRSGGAKMGTLGDLLKQKLGK
jgi:small subunit ribosomal protein S1